LNLQIAEYEKLGYSLPIGIGTYFQNKAYGNKKTVGLESVEPQLKIMNDLSDKELEKQYLIDVKNMEEVGANTNKLYEAYKAGDEKALVELVIKPAKKYPESYKKIIVDRNIAMADKIDGYLKSDDTYFVVAGVAHYVGDDSVVKLLEKKGYTVKRVK
jgi:uncharacterized protein YbaP (TraB family)